MVRFLTAVEAPSVIGPVASRDLAFRVRTHKGGLVRRSGNGDSLPASVAPVEILS